MLVRIEIYIEKLNLGYEPCAVIRRHTPCLDLSDNITLIFQILLFYKDCIKKVSSIKILRPIRAKNNCVNAYFSNV